MNWPLRVAHLVNTYLDHSRTWLHRQIVATPDVQPIVVAFREVDDGPQHFPVPALTILSTMAPRTFALSRIWPFNAANLTGKLARPVLKSNRPDLVHAHFGNVAWDFLSAVRAEGLPLVTSFYGRDMSERPRSDPRWRNRYEELFEYGALFLCEGPAMAQGLADLGCPTRKIAVHRLGMDLDRFTPSPRVLRRADPLRVLTVGRFTEKKGIPDAIEAVALASRHVNVQLTIVGEGRPHERETKRIEEAVRASALGDRITLAGRLTYDALAVLQRDFHVVLQPSHRSSTGDTEGGAPVSLIELAGAGLAAVSTRHADIPQVVLDGETGLLAAEKDVNALADCLIRMATQPDLVTSFGQAGANHVRRLFDQQQCGSELRDRYRDVLAYRVGGADRS